MPTEKIPFVDTNNNSNNNNTPCMFTVNPAFVALDVTLGQDLILHGACNELADQL